PRVSASAAWPSVPGVARRPTWVVNGISRRAAAVPEACCSSWGRAASGERRNCCTLAISTSSFSIQQYGWPECHGDDLVGHEGLEGVTFAVETMVDQCQSERASKGRRMIRGGHPAVLRNHPVANINWGVHLDQRFALFEPEGGIICEY